MKELIKAGLAVFLFLVSLTSNAVETTPYGKIVGIETRAWGLHVQTDFGAGSALGCAVTPGSAYMYDFVFSNANRNGGNADFTQSTLLAAFVAGTEVSFHLYNCNSVRPEIGYVRLKN